MEICIIGAGTYGCYIANLLTKKMPLAQITIFEVGNSQIKNETQIGFSSNLKGSKYTGLKDGRFFGFGGTSAKWGGQLLFFSRNDFLKPEKYLQDIVYLNEQYKEDILKQFGKTNDIVEKRVSNNLFIKTGVWLSYFNRNLFKYYKLKNNKNIRIISNSRIVRIEPDGNKIMRIKFLQDNHLKEEAFDFYFLTSGAFESNRILMESKIINGEYLKFSDHLSQRVFKIKKSTCIGDEDFSFKIEGSSLITKRLIGEVNGTSFFAHPIFNSEFKFFQSFKKILFKHEFTFFDLKNIFLDIPHVILFIYSFFLKRKLYVYKGEWYIQIDIENPAGSSFMNLSDHFDKFGQSAIDIHFEAGDSTEVMFTKAKDIIRSHLIKNKVDFEEYIDTIHHDKFEDTYHPFGMMSDFISVNDYFTKFENMLIVNSGILPRAGGINSTAAVLPMIHEYINSFLVQSTRQ